MDCELTQKEINFIEAAEDVAELAAEGMTAGQIAAELHLSSRDVQSIIHNCVIPAYRKLCRKRSVSGNKLVEDPALLTSVLDIVFNTGNGPVECEDYLSALGNVSLKYFKSAGNSPVLMSRKERGGLRYCPESLGVRLLTVQGLFILKTDPEMTERTFEELKLTEAPLLYGSFSGYRYLLAPHDPGKTAEEFFYSGRGSGIGHLSVLLRDKPDRSLVSLISEYSADKNIPFIVGAVLIHDLMEHEGGIFVYRPESGSENYTRYEWKSPEFRAAPPVSYRRLSQTGYESYPGADDRYIRKTYADSRFCTVQTAEKLGISRQTAAQWLKKSSVAGNNQYPAVPDTGTADAFLDLSIAAEYLRSKGVTAAAAEKVSMSESDYMLRAKRLIKSKGGTSDLAFLAAGIVCPGNTENAAELLGMSPGWYIRKLQLLRKKLSSDDGIAEILPGFYFDETADYPRSA